MTKRFVKFVGLAVTAAGMGLTLIDNWVTEKEMEEQIEEKVNEALAKKENEES